MLYCPADEDLVLAIRTMAKEMARGCSKLERGGSIGVFSIRSLHHQFWHDCARESTDGTGG
jgi:hypothetical protein